MKTKFIRLFTISIISLISLTIYSQDEYHAEIGVSGGGAYYLGDANNLMFNNIQLSYGGFFRYNINSRVALRAEINSGTISGNFSFLNNPIKLNNTIYSADLCGEVNFFDLEQNSFKRFSKTFSPYIFAGIGAMTDLYTGQTIPEISFPFGLGMKLKLGNRWNLNFQWSNKLLLPIIKVNGIYHSDYIEGVSILNDPNNLNGSNIFANDLLSTITIGISYDIWKKECKCMNSN